MVRRADVIALRSAFPPVTVDSPLSRLYCIFTPAGHLLTQSDAAMQSLLSDPLTFGASGAFTALSTYRLLMRAELYRRSCNDGSRWAEAALASGFWLSGRVGIGVRASISTWDSERA